MVCLAVSLSVCPNPPTDGCRCAPQRKLAGLIKDLWDETAAFRK